MESLKPKAIFFELFYNLETWGIILAAKKLKIPAIEVQHGRVGRYQWFSTHWGATREEGECLLPDYFWVFDEESKNNVVRSVGLEPKPLDALVGGIPSLTAWAIAE